MPPLRALALALLVLPPLRAAAQCGPPSLPEPAVRESLLVSPAWLAARLDDPSLVILHTDDAASYRAGHVPGAVLADPMRFTAGNHELPPLAVLDTLVEALGISDASRVILVGGPAMTGWMFLVLDVLGHGDRTAVLDGGVERWRAERRPVETRAARPARGRFTPRPRTGVVVDAAWVAAHRRDDRLALVDTRTAEEYAGTAAETLPRRGHIPGARLLPWERTFTDPAGAFEGRSSPLRSVADLRALFHAAGAGPGRDPVVYCTVGMRASHVYFVARYLGYDPRIYDGSMSDWSRRSELPIETGPSRGIVR